MPYDFWNAIVTSPKIFASQENIMAVAGYKKINPKTAKIMTTLSTTMARKKSPTEQKLRLPGRASWHPGFRVHQLTGRIITFTILMALKEVLVYWQCQHDNDYELSDDVWRVTDYYENIRKKVQNLDPSIGTCYNFQGRITSNIVCRYPIQVCNNINRCRGVEQIFFFFGGGGGGGFFFLFFFFLGGGGGLFLFVHLFVECIFR